MLYNTQKGTPILFLTNNDTTKWEMRKIRKMYLVGQILADIFGKRLHF